MTLFVKTDSAFVLEHFFFPPSLSLSGPRQFPQETVGSAWHPEPPRLRSDPPDQPCARYTEEGLGSEWDSQVISVSETSDLQMLRVQLKAPQKEKRGSGDLGGLVFFPPSPQG